MSTLFRRFAGCVSLSVIVTVLIFNFAHLLHGDHPLSVSSAEHHRMTALHAVLKPFNKLPSQVPRQASVRDPILRRDNFGQFRETFVEDARSFVLFAPKSLELVTPSPLLLLFHDHSQSAWQLALFRSGWAKRAARFEFVVAFLQADIVNSEAFHIDKDAITASAWKTSVHVNATNIHDDIAFVSTVLDDLLVEFHIDRRQIFAIGYGAGSIFAARASLFFAATWASVCLIGGGFDVAVSPGPWDSPRVPSLLVVTKQGDQYRDLAEKGRDLFRGANGEAKLMELAANADLESYNATLEDQVWQWFQSHRLLV